MPKHTSYKTFSPCCCSRTCRTLQHSCAAPYRAIHQHRIYCVVSELCRLVNLTKTWVVSRRRVMVCIAVAVYKCKRDAGACRTKMATLRPADPIATSPEPCSYQARSATARRALRPRALCSCCRGRFHTASFNMMLSLLWWMEKMLPHHFSCGDGGKWHYSETCLTALSLLTPACRPSEAV